MATSTETHDEPAEEEREVPPPKDGFLGSAAEIGELVGFAGRSARAMPGASRYLAETLRHTQAQILTTTPFLFTLNVFFGFVTMNTGYFILAPLGAVDYLGAITAFGIHVSPVIMFTYVFISKVCGGFVAEVGAMKINQEIDAYESTGVDPMRFVVATRLLAVFLYLPFAFVVTLAGYHVGCYLDAVVVLAATDTAGYFQFNWQSQGLRDQFFVLTSAGLIAMSCAAVSCFYGLRASGGPAAVGASVAQAIKVNFVLANVISAFTVILWYGKDAGVPIGG